LHLTLARFRPEEFRRFAGQELEEKISWHETIDNITIFESILSPGGAEYKVIKVFSLARAG